MATNPEDTNSELAEAYRRFEAAHEAGDYESAKQLKTYAEQLEAMAQQGPALRSEEPPESAPTLKPEKSPHPLGSKIFDKDTWTAMKVSGNNMLSNYLSSRERDRQSREVAGAIVKRQLPAEMQEEIKQNKSLRSDDFQALDVFGQSRWGKKYTDIVDGIAAKDPKSAKVIDSARKSKAINLYDNIIRPYFSKDGVNPSAQMEEHVARLRESYNPDTLASSQKPWLAEEAVWYKPGSWFDETTKAPWHDFDGFYISTMENSVQLAALPITGRAGGAIGARLGLAAAGGAGAKGALSIATARQAISRGASTGGAIAGGASEGILIRDATSQQTYDQLMGLDDKTWKTNEEYQLLRENGATDTEAKQLVATDISMKAGNVAMVASGFMLGAPAGHVFGRMASGQASRSFVANIAKGAATEVGQESAQEGIEQVIGNLGVRRVDPQQNIFEGVGEGIVGGAFTAAVPGALGGVGARKKAPGLSKEQQGALDAIRPWEEAADARWKLQNKLTDDDWAKSLHPEEMLAQVAKLESAQQKEAEAFLKAEPALRRSMIQHNAPDADLIRLDQLKASANTMLMQVKKARESRKDARTEADAARKMIRERQELVDAVQQDVIKRDDIKRMADNIERVRNQEALSGEEYAQLEKMGYGKFNQTGSRFTITPKGARALPELRQQAEVTQARVAGMYTGEERRSNQSLRERIEEMTPEQREAAIYRDPTTNVLNRRAFEEADHAPAYAEVDVDSLKWVNDNMSVEAGDRLIKRVAEVLSQQEGVTVYRLGGDEFGLLGESEEQLETALQRARIELDDTQPITEERQSIVPSMTWAVGKNRKEVTAKVTKQKAKREKAGRRAARGQKPPSYRDLSQILLLHRNDENDTPAMRAIKKFHANLAIRFRDPPVSEDEVQARFDYMREGLEATTGAKLNKRERKKLRELAENHDPHEALRTTNKIILMHRNDDDRLGLLTDDELAALDEELERIAYEAEDVRVSGKTYRFGDLPSDMRIEINKIAKTHGSGYFINSDYVPLYDVPVEYFPTNREPSPDREIGSMVSLEGLPPVVIARTKDGGYQFIDGLHRLAKARERGIKTVRAIDVSARITSNVHFISGLIIPPNDTVFPAKKNAPRQKKTQVSAMYPDLHINDVDGGYPLPSDHIPGQFPSNKLIIPKALYLQMSPEDLEFVLDGNSNLAIPSYVAADLYEHLAKENGIENDHQVITAVSKLDGAKLKQGTITHMRQGGINRRATVSVRSFNAMLAGINMAANNLTAETVKGNAAIGISPIYELVREPSAPKRQTKKQQQPVQRNLSIALEVVGGARTYETTQSTFKPYRPSMVINRDTAALLKSKENIGIWCHADEYFGPNKLTGFFTGMFVSETSEAKMMGVKDATLADVDVSNDEFAKIAAKYIDLNPNEMYEKILADYSKLAVNPVVAYNIKEMEEARETSYKNQLASRKPVERPAALKTLVIHPADKSTDFLKPIYSGHPEWTVVTGNDMSIDEVNELIKSHDRIIMMGHGAPSGLMGVGQFTGDIPTYAPVSYKYPRASQEKMQRARFVRDALQRLFKNLPQIHLHETATDLDQKMLSDLMQNGESLTGVRGMFDNSNYPSTGIHIVVGNIHDGPDGLERSIAETIFHELVGHYGLRGLAGSSVVLQRITDSILDSFSEKNVVSGRGAGAIEVALGNGKTGKIYTSETMAKRLFPKNTFEEVMADRAKRSLVGEEMFAYLTGEVLARHIVMPKPQMSAWQRAIQAIKQWLIERGFGRWLGKRGVLSDADVQNLIARAQDFVRTGKQWKFVDQYGQRQLVMMRERDFFKAGIITAIERGVINKARNPGEKQRMASGEKVPLFKDIDSIQNYMANFKEGVAMGIFSKVELEESGMLRTLKTNPTEWVMHLLGQDSDQLSANTEIPKAIIEKMANGESAEDKYLDKLLNYMRTPDLFAHMSNGGAVQEGMLKLLSKDSLKHATIMNYGNFNVIVGNAMGGTANNQNIYDNSLFPDEIANRLQEIHTAEDALDEADSDAAKALQKEREEILSRPVDPTKTKLTREILRALTEQSALPRIMAWPVRFEPTVADAYYRVTGKNAGQYLTINEITDAGEREATRAELEAMRERGYDTGYDPKLKKWFEFSKYGSVYRQFSPLGSFENGATEYKEVLLYQVGGRAAETIRTVKRMDGHDHFRGSAQGPPGTGLKGGNQFTHIRLGVGRDGSDNPPTAPNPKYQGKVLVRIEDQSDVFQYLTFGGISNDQEVQDAESKFVKARGKLRTATTAFANSVIGKMHSRIMEIFGSKAGSDSDKWRATNEDVNRMYGEIRDLAESLEQTATVNYHLGDPRAKAAQAMRPAHALADITYRAMMAALEGTQSAINSGEPVEARSAMMLRHMLNAIGDYPETANIKTPGMQLFLNFTKPKEALEKIYGIMGISPDAIAANLEAASSASGGSVKVDYDKLRNEPGGWDSRMPDPGLRALYSGINFADVFYDRPLRAMRGTAHAAYLRKSADADEDGIEYIGPKEHFASTMEAYKKALRDEVRKAALQHMPQSSFSMREGRSPITNLATMERIIEWLGMEKVISESTEENDDVQAPFDVVGLQTMAEYVEGRINEAASEADEDDYFDWDNYDHEGSPLNEDHPDYQELVEEELDEDGDPIGDRDTEAADRWLQRTRREIANAAREPGGAIYEAELENLRDQYRDQRSYVWVGQLPVNWDEDGEVTETFPIHIGHDGADNTEILHINEEDVTGWLRMSGGENGIDNGVLASKILEYYRNNGITPPDKALPWTVEAAAATPEDPRTTAANKTAEFVISTLNVEQSESESVDPVQLGADLIKLDVKRQLSVGELSIMGRDDRWKLANLRTLIIDAVARGIPKVQWASGDATKARGAISPANASTNRITWSVETISVNGKDQDLFVIRSGDPGIPPIAATADTLYAVIGKDATDYIQKQMAGEVPRTMGSRSIEPSRSDLLVSKTGDAFVIKRVGASQVLAVAFSEEELNQKLDELVSAAKETGGWPDQRGSRRRPQQTAAIPENAKQWGEVTESDINGLIPLYWQSSIDSSDHQYLWGARMSYDVIGRRLYNRELKKYGVEVKTGKQLIPYNEIEMQKQGFHRADKIPQAVREAHGNVRVAEIRGEHHGFVVMGDRGMVLNDIFASHEMAASALDSYVRDKLGGNVAVNVWEFEVNDKMREVFSQPHTPFHYDPYNDPILKEAAKKIGSRQPSMRDRYSVWRSNWKDAFTQGALDRFYGIKRAMKEAGIAELEAEFNGYIQARLSTSLDSVMRSIMEFGHPVWRDGIMQTDGVGLLDILEPVSENIDLWAMYMAGVRAKRLLGEGRERNWTPEQIDRMVALGDAYPIFKRVAREYAAFHKQVLDFAEAAGTINPETRPMWENADYIPFYRVKDDRLVGPMSTSAGIANVSSPIKKLKGGTDNVGDLMHNIMINLTRLMDGAMKNHAALMTVDALRPSGIVSNQPMAWSEQLIPMEQVKKALKERGVDPDTIPPEALTGFQKMFALQAPKGKGIISVMRNGKKEFYQTSDPLLYRAMSAINKQYFGNWMRILRAPKRLLTTWITLDPGFMVANYLRDALSSFVISRDNVVPLAAGVGGFVRALGQSEEMRTMMSAGAAFENGYINQYDPTSTKRLLKREFKSSKPSDIMLDSPRKLYNLWKRIGAASENANRIAVYRAARAAGKSKAQAAYEAKDLMDFSMAGDWGVIQFLVQTVPFLGARIQGLHRLGRAFNENPIATTLKGSLVGLAGMALWLAFRDDERYKELEDWDKDTYFHFWIGDNHYRLPKPFEVGAIFNTIPERVFEYMYSKETDAGKLLMRRFGFVLSEMFNMNPIPQAAQPMVESWFNYNFFTRSQIESPYEEERLPPERYRYSTSPTMIEIARHLPAGLDTVSGKIRSPLQLQNLYYGYTGTLGRYFLMGADALVREAMDLPLPPEKTVGDYPVVGRFVRGSDPRRTRYEEEFYNTLRRAVQVQGSVEFLKDASEDQRMEYVEGKYEPFIEVGRELENARRQVSRINKEMREIYLDREMTPERKRTEINSLQQEKNEIFEEAYHLRPGGKDNQPRITPDKIGFFIDKFNRDEPPSPAFIKAAPATAELLTDVSGLSRRQLQSLAKTGAPE